jgi:hypothetical protein
MSIEYIKIKRRRKHDEHTTQLVGRSKDMENALSLVLILSFAIASSKSISQVIGRFTAAESMLLVE